MDRRGLFFTSPRAVEIRTETLSDLLPGEIAVDTMVTAISPGTEMLVYRGQLPEGLAADESIAALDGALAYPLKYGYSAAGVIAALGEGIDPALLGRKVFSFQPHVTGFIARLEDVILLPEDLPVEEAVFLPNVETALGLVMDAAPLAGERAAVLGQGIVGLLTTALLAEFPLERLVAFDRFDLRRSF